MENTLLVRYAKLEAEYKEVEKKREELRQEIVDEMTKEKLEKVESDYGQFTIGRRQSWQYSPAVLKLEEKVKIAKTKEQQKGIAEAKETEYLVYKPVKQI